MRVSLLAGTSLLALAVGAGAARATTFNFIGNGAVGLFIAPRAGTYEITAIGAQGGSNTNVTLHSSNSGGLGVEVSDSFFLSRGETLEIVVGGQGGSVFQGAYSAPGRYAGGGGGGGSFVVTTSGTPLLIAGGGGGAESFGPGGQGQFGNSGQAGGGYGGA